MHFVYPKKKKEKEIATTTTNTSGHRVPICDPSYKAILPLGYFLLIHLGSVESIQDTNAHLGRVELMQDTDK